MLSALQWPHAFFSGSIGGVERFFRLDAFLHHGPTIEIGIDASPWGMGGWLAKDGRSLIILLHRFRPKTNPFTTWMVVLLMASNYGNAWRFLLPLSFGPRIGSKTAS